MLSFLIVKKVDEMIFNLYEVSDLIHESFNGGVLSENNNYEILLRFNPDNSIVAINFRTVIGASTVFTNLKNIPTLYYPLDKVYDRSFFINTFDGVFKVSNFSEALIKHVKSSNLNHSSILYDNFYHSHYTGGERTTNIAVLEALKNKYEFDKNLYYTFKGSDIIKIIRHFDEHYPAYMVDAVER